MKVKKQIGSLVITGALLASMLPVSASATTFLDEDTIVNTEAVKTMVELGVIVGRDTGEFDPTGTVTRGEMAKMIAVILNGGSDPDLEGDTVEFSDVTDHWAEPYIAYCVGLGIVDGYGDGTFGPDDTVTGVEGAKLLLCALGYDSDQEGLTGATWEENTQSLADAVGLYQNLAQLEPTDGMSRDSAAQMMYNGIYAQEVVYTEGVYSQIGTMLEIRFNVTQEETEEEVEAEVEIEEETEAEEEEEETGYQTDYATSGDWMYIYEKTGVSGAGDIVSAITDNGVMEQILIDDSGADMAVGSVYSYKLTDDGYKLYNLYASRGAFSYGTVSIKGSNTLVLDDAQTLSEYSYDSSTQLFYVDDKYNVELDEGFEVGDFVLTILDDDEVLAVIILEKYESSQGEILAYNSAILTQVSQDYYTISGDSVTVSDVTGALLLSYGATVEVYDQYRQLSVNEVLTSADGYTFVLVSEDGTRSQEYLLTNVDYNN